MTDLRIYNSNDVGPDGYPSAWHHDHFHDDVRYPPIKDTIRALAGHRCVRCGHPYPPGIAAHHPRGEWTPCDEHCTHGGIHRPSEEIPLVESQWRILTVHHLNGVKWDCRWWNLISLCQRCHLTIQGKVILDRDFAYEHSEWFKIYAAGWYSMKYRGIEVTRDEAEANLNELLSYELTHKRLPGFE